jgi:hypothetical protein
VSERISLPPTSKSDTGANTIAQEAIVSSMNERRIDPINDQRSINGSTASLPGSAWRGEEEEVEEEVDEATRPSSGGEEPPSQETSNRKLFWEGATLSPRVLLLTYVAPTDDSTTTDTGRDEYGRDGGSVASNAARKTTAMCYYGRPRSARQRVGTYSCGGFQVSCKAFPATTTLLCYLPGASWPSNHNDNPARRQRRNNATNQGGSTSSIGVLLPVPSSADKGLAGRPGHSLLLIHRTCGFPPFKGDSFLHRTSRARAPELPHSRLRGQGTTRRARRTKRLDGGTRRVLCKFHCLPTSAGLSFCSEALFIHHFNGTRLFFLFLSLKASRTVQSLT